MRGRPAHQQGRPVSGDPLTPGPRNRMLHLQRENRRLLDKIEEIRLVDRAKCMLIQYQDMTEPPSPPVH